MGKKAAAAALVLGLGLLAGSVSAVARVDAQIRQLEEATTQIDAYLAGRSPAPFVNRLPSPATGPDADEHNGARYAWVAPEGFTLLSHSEAWDDEKLEQLYEELKKNRHGEELLTLHQVVVYAEADEYALASHAQDIAQAQVRFEHPAMPPGFLVPWSRDVSVINLFDGDTYTTVESMAHSLSHEYGHLYTFYHMFPGGSPAGTEYAVMRQSAENGLIEETDYSVAAYLENHHRYLVEVAAEDYVQLMGSPTTRQVIDIPDVRQLLGGAEYPDPVLFDSANNWCPQENMTLPLANAVPGLAEYYYGFVEETPPVLAAKQPMEIGIVSATSNYDLEDGYHSFTHYTLSWDTPYPGAIYTLICREAGDDFYFPVKTVRPGQRATATIGTVAVESAEYVTWLYDEIDSGEKEFLVVALLEDLSFQLSEPLVYRFG